MCLLSSYGLQEQLYAAFHEPCTKTPIIKSIRVKSPWALNRTGRRTADRDYSEEQEMNSIWATCAAFRSLAFQKSESFLVFK